MSLRTTISAILSVALLAAALAGCVDEEEEKVEDQRRQFRTYLDSRALEYDERGGVFVHYALRDSLTLSPEAAVGDTVVFRFDASVFTGGGGRLYYTDNLYSALSAGLDTALLDLTPRRVRLGYDSIIKGLEHSLVGCRRNDSMVVFIPSDLGYSRMNMGVVDMDSPLMFVLNIEDVIH